MLFSRTSNFSYIGHHWTPSEEKNHMGSRGCVSTQGMDFTLCWKYFHSVLKKKKKKNVGNKKTCCNEPCEAVHNQITGGSIFQRFESQDIASILGCTWLTV